jgi:hypothetical protein
MGKHDRESLINFCDKNGVVLDVLPDECNRETRVSGPCLTKGCDDCFEKTIRSLFETSGPYCETCCKKNCKIKAFKTQNLEFNGEITIWNEELLQSLDIKNAHYDGNLNRDTPIGGDCQIENCCNRFLKPFREVREQGGPFCTTCCKKNCKIKAFKTQNLEFNGEITNWNEELLQSLDIKNAYYDGNLNRDTPIGGDCQIENCCNRFLKPFREVREKGGPFCTTCSKINRVKKTLTTQNLEIKTDPVIYDYKLLERIIKTRKLHINLSRYKGKYLSRESLIKGMCIIPNCPDMFEKNFRSLYENDVPCCETCTKRVRMSRSKKARFEKEEFKTPGGQTWYLQGYESLVAPELIKEYGEENITAAIEGDRRVPAIPWFDEDGGKHHYFCDFFIPNLNLIIEVKSTWTEEQNDDKIKRTRKASNELGYDFRLIVLDNKKEWIEDITSSSQHPPYNKSCP